jgi:DNA-binding transcriptional MerR regulator
VTDARREAGHLSIGEVLAELADDFPDITISKIRFLESQGLIDPERTPSGYRKFYASDVERLRWILFQQKEHYLPLKVIKERLERETDNGETEPARVTGNGNGRSAALLPPLVSDREDDDEDAEDDEFVSSNDLTRSEIADAAGLDSAQLADLEAFGLLTPIQAGDRVLFDDDALAVARAAAGFHRHGIEARHLRMYRTFADRESTLFEQALLSSLRRRNPGARDQAQADLASLIGHAQVLRTALLRQALRDSLPECRACLASTARSCSSDAPRSPDTYADWAARSRPITPTE